MSKEILIPHGEISNSQTITEVTDRKFKEQGLDLHKDEVTDLDDDFKKGVRKLTVKNTKYFYFPDIPWHK